MVSTNNEKATHNCKIKTLSTTLLAWNMYIITPIKTVYLKMNRNIFFIPELIFFGSGLYAAKILSKIDLVNGATIPVAIIVKIIVIICLLSIAYNLSAIIKNGVKWWMSLK